MIEQTTSGSRELRAGELAARLPRLWLGESSDASLAAPERTLAATWRTFTDHVLANKLDCCVSAAYDGASVDGLNRSLAAKYLSADPGAAFVMGGFTPEIGNTEHAGRFGEGYGRFDFGEFESLILEEEALATDTGADAESVATARRQASLFARSAARGTARRGVASGARAAAAPRSAAAAPAHTNRAAAVMQPYPARLGQAGATLRPRVSERRMMPAAQQRLTRAQLAQAVVTSDALARRPSAADFASFEPVGAFLEREADVRSPIARADALTNATIAPPGARPSSSRPASSRSARTASPSARSRFDASAPNASPASAAAALRAIGLDRSGHGITLDGLTMKAAQAPALASALAVTAAAFPDARPGHAASRQAGVFSPTRMAPALRVASLDGQSGPRLGLSTVPAAHSYRRLLYDAVDHSYLAVNEPERAPRIDAASPEATPTRAGRRVSAANGAVHALAARMPAVVSSQHAASAALGQRVAGTTARAAVPAAGATTRAGATTQAGVITLAAALRHAATAARATTDARTSTAVSPADAPLGVTSARRAAQTATERDRVDVAAPPAWSGASSVLPVAAPVADLAGWSIPALARALAAATASAPSNVSSHLAAHTLGALPTRLQGQSLASIVPSVGRSHAAEQRQSTRLRAEHQQAAAPDLAAAHSMGTVRRGGQHAAVALDVTSTPSELFAASHLRSQAPRLSRNLEPARDLATTAGQVRVDVGAYAMGFDDPVVFLDASEGAVGSAISQSDATTPAAARAMRMSPRVASALRSVTAPLSSVIELDHALTARRQSESRRTATLAEAGHAEASLAETSTVAPTFEARTRSARAAASIESQRNEHPTSRVERSRSRAPSTRAFAADGAPLFTTRIVDAAPQGSPSVATQGYAAFNRDATSFSTGAAATAFASRLEAALTPSVASSGAEPAFYETSYDAESVFLSLDARDGGLAAGEHVEIRDGRVVRTSPASATSARQSRVQPVRASAAGRSTADALPGRSPAARAALLTERAVTTGRAASRPELGQSAADVASSIRLGAQRSVASGRSRLERGVDVLGTGATITAASTPGAIQIGAAGARFGAAGARAASPSAERRAAAALATHLLGGLPTLSRDTYAKVERQLESLTHRSPGRAGRLASLLGQGPTTARTAIAAELTSMGIDVGELLSSIDSDAAFAPAARAEATDALQSPRAKSSSKAAQAAMRALTGTAAAGRLETITTRDRYFDTFAPVRLAHETPAGRLQALLAPEGVTRRAHRVAAQAELGEVLGLREAAIGSSSVAAEGLVAARRTAGRTALSTQQPGSSLAARAAAASTTASPSARTEPTSARTIALERPTIAALASLSSSPVADATSLSERLGVASTPWRPRTAATEGGPTDARVAQFAPELSPIALRPEVGASRVDEAADLTQTKRRATRAADAIARAVAARSGAVGAKHTSAAGAATSDGARWFKSLSSQTVATLLSRLPGQRALSSAIPGGLDLSATVIDRANGAFANLDAGVVEFLSRTAARLAQGGTGRELRPGLDDWPAETLEMLQGTGFGQSMQRSGGDATVQTAEPKVQRLERRVDAARQAWARIQSSRARQNRPQSVEGVNWDLVSTGATRETPGGADLTKLASTMVRPAAVPQTEMAYVAPAVKVVAQQAQLSEAPGRGGASAAQPSAGATEGAGASEPAKIDYDGLARQMMTRLNRRWEFERQRRGGG